MMKVFLSEKFITVSYGKLADQVTLKAPCKANERPILETLFKINCLGNEWNIFRILCYYPQPLLATYWSRCQSLSFLDKEGYTYDIIHSPLLFFCEAVKYSCQHSSMLLFFLHSSSNKPWKCRNIDNVLGKNYCVHPANVSNIL